MVVMIAGRVVGRSANGSETAMSMEEVLFQSEQIDVMHAAFVIACTKLRLRVGSKESDRVALKIVDLAKAGEHDAKMLAALALSEISDDGSRS